MSLTLSGCGTAGDSGTTPNSSPLAIMGVAEDDGHFDAAPTVDASSMIWMSYSHVIKAPSGLKSVETRLATTTDGGTTWQDAGIVNAASSLPLSPPQENFVNHEVSRLVYDPYAPAAGTSSWILLWHRFLTVWDGSKAVRLFEHGWIGMKSADSAITLGGERKLFTGSGYDTANNADAVGAPEFPLATLYPAALGDCVAFTEPGVLPKSGGLYVAMLCAKVTLPGKIVLLRCEHDVSSCTYLGDLIDGAEANAIDPSYEGFSAPELVAAGGKDYLIVTPTVTAGNLYRGCVAYRIVDLDSASIERIGGTPVESLVIPAQGDFNGACAYVEELSGSGIIMSEAFFTQTPTFRLFATEEQL